MDQKESVGRPEGQEEPYWPPKKSIVKRLTEAWVAAIALTGVLGGGSNVHGGNGGQTDGVSGKVGISRNDASKQELPQEAGQERSCTFNHLQFVSLGAKQKIRQFFRDQFEREWETSGSCVRNQRTGAPMQGQWQFPWSGAGIQGIQGRIVAVQDGKQLEHYLYIAGIVQRWDRWGRVFLERVEHTFKLVPKGTIQKAEEGAKMVRDRAREKEKETLERLEEAGLRRYVTVGRVQGNRFVDGKEQVWILRKGRMPSLEVGVSVAGKGNLADVRREEDLWVLSLGGGAVEFARPVGAWGKDPLRPASFLPR